MGKGFCSGAPLGWGPGQSPLSTVTPPEAFAWRIQDSMSQLRATNLVKLRILITAFHSDWWNSGWFFPWFFYFSVLAKFFIMIIYIFLLPLNIYFKKLKIMLVYYFRIGCIIVTHIYHPICVSWPPCFFLLGRSPGLCESLNKQKSNMKKKKPLRIPPPRENYW